MNAFWPAAKLTAYGVRANWRCSPPGVGAASLQRNHDLARQPRRLDAAAVVDEHEPLALAEVALGGVGDDEPPVVAEDAASEPQRLQALEILLRLRIGQSATSPRRGSRYRSGCAAGHRPQSRRPLWSPGSAARCSRCRSAGSRRVLRESLPGRRRALRALRSWPSAAGAGRGPLAAGDAASRAGYPRPSRVIQPRPPGRETRPGAAGLA